MLKCRCCNIGRHQSPFAVKKFCSLPMISLEIAVKIVDGLASIFISQTFVNRSSKSIECNYRFPVLESSVLTSLTIIFSDGSTITAKVEEETTAAEIYQDAIASGDTAIMLEEESSKYMSLNIGNLTPRESINVNFKYSAPLESDEDK